MKESSGEQGAIVIDSGLRETVDDKSTLAILAEISEGLKDLPDKPCFQSLGYKPLPIADTDWRNPVLTRQVDDAVRYGENPLYVFNSDEGENAELIAGERNIEGSPVKRQGLITPKKDYQRKTWAVMEMEDNTVFVTETDANTIPSTYELIEGYLRNQKGEDISIQPLLDDMRDSYGVHDSEMPPALEDLRTTLLQQADNMHDEGIGFLQTAITKVKQDSEKILSEASEEEEVTKDEESLAERESVLEKDELSADEEEISKQEVNEDIRRAERNLQLVQELFKEDDIEANVQRINKIIREFQILKDSNILQFLERSDIPEEYEMILNADIRIYSALKRSLQYKELATQVTEMQSSEK